MLYLGGAYPQIRVLFSRANFPALASSTLNEQATLYLPECFPEDSTRKSFLQLARLRS